MANYTRPQAPFEGAARGSVQDRLTLDKNFHDRISDLERKTGGASFDLTKQTPVAAPPPVAGLQVHAQPGTGRFILQITNPQFLTQNPGNKIQAPIYHVAEFSDTPAFSKVDALPPTTQTYLEVSKYGVGVSKYIRVKSSYDGKQFNTPISAGLHTS